MRVCVCVYLCKCVCARGRERLWVGVIVCARVNYFSVRRLMYMCGMTLAYVKYHYGVATISRLLKIIGLFCRILSLYEFSFAKETYNFKV